MSIITISSDSYQLSQEIAEKTAGILNYKCLGREILTTIAETDNIPESGLHNALDGSKSLLRMTGRVRNRYMACIKSAVLSRLLNDNTVCCGLAAHLYLSGVSHVLKVKILSDFKEHGSRIESEKKFSPRKEQHWRKFLEASQIDKTDASRYDLVINLGQIEKEKAVHIIIDTVKDRKFMPMTYSINCIEDIELESRVHKLLIERFPHSAVQAKRGSVVVKIRTFKYKKQEKSNAIKEMLNKISGVVHVDVYVKNYISWH